VSTLVQIHQDYLAIIEQIEANCGEITEQLETYMVKNLIESKEKVSNYCLILDKYTSEIEFMKAKVKEAVAFIDRLEKQKEHLEKIALDVVNAKGEKLEGVGGNWINKRKSVSLEIINESLIPPIYYKIETKLDKAAVKEAILKRGEHIEGCVIRENTSLQWK
jgi:DNA repair ATPase RecN